MPIDEQEKISSSIFFVNRSEATVGLFSWSWSLAVSSWYLIRTILDITWLSLPKKSPDQISGIFPIPWLLDISPDPSATAGSHSVINTRLSGYNFKSLLFCMCFNYRFERMFICFTSFKSVLPVAHWPTIRRCQFLGAYRSGDMSILKIISLRC